MEKTIEEKFTDAVVCDWRLSEQVKACAEIHKEGCEQFDIWKSKHAIQTNLLRNGDVLYIKNNGLPLTFNQLYREFQQSKIKG